MNPTRDSLLGGRVTLWQPPRGAGYRFNLDPVLLASFVRPSGGHVLDVGAGCGVIGLLLLALGKAERVTAVEVQPQLAELLRKNVADNGVAERFTVLEGDVRTLALPTVDAVVCNPPYFRAGDGRGSADEGREAGRRERNGRLHELVAAGLSALGRGGTFGAIITSQRGDELAGLLTEAGATALRRRRIVPRAGKPVGHVLLEATLASPRATTPPRLVDEPALVVHDGDDFGAEVRRMLDPSLAAAS